ncbi:MAG: aminopeptidase P family protein, partial [Symploca sp. SIO1A3]|nr:aminopeptidase P family protein [Symploca sp. SIO1A3]
MEIHSDYSSLATTLRTRRQRLAEKIAFPVILWSGGSSSRNFPANHYPFRASSHFLYFAGLPLKNAAIFLDGGRLELFMDEDSAENALWHGEMPKREEIAQIIGADAAFPLSALPTRATGAATIALQDASTYQQQADILNRSVTPSYTPEGIDRDLAKAIASVRLCHDAGAISELRQAAAVTIEAHKAGMGAARTAKQEAAVRGAMEGRGGSVGIGWLRVRIC